MNYYIDAEFDPATGVAKYMIYREIANRRREGVIRVVNELVSVHYDYSEACIELVRLQNEYERKLRSWAN